MPAFTSSGKEIRIDHYSPGNAAGRSPAIIIVHGSGGPLHGIDPYAQQAANFGLHVFALHFFDRTGHQWVRPDEIRQYFPEWLETLRDAVSFVAAQPGTDHQRIGLLGFSLGAFLSLSLATQDSRIAGVADFFGGLPEHFVPEAAKLPPVLILHGAQDDIVPVAQAYSLEALLRQHHVPHEIKIYSDQGHAFRGLAQLDAMRRVAGFFRRLLFQAA